MFTSLPLIRTIPDPPDALTLSSVISFVRASYVAPISESPRFTAVTGSDTVGLLTRPARHIAR